MSGRKAKPFNYCECVRLPARRLWQLRNAAQSRDKIIHKFRDGVRVESYGNSKIDGLGGDRFR
jgi:hypothetical protein